MNRIYVYTTNARRILKTKLFIQDDRMMHDLQDVACIAFFLSDFKNVYRMIRVRKIDIIYAML